MPNSLTDPQNANEVVAYLMQLEQDGKVPQPDDFDHSNINMVANNGTAQQIGFVLDEAMTYLKPGDRFNTVVTSLLNGEAIYAKGRDRPSADVLATCRAAAECLPELVRRGLPKQWQEQAPLKVPDAFQAFDAHVMGMSKQLPKSHYSQFTASAPSSAKPPSPERGGPALS